MSNIEQYSPETYREVLTQLAAAPPNPRRDEHYVEVLKEFLSKYRIESLTFLGVRQ